MPWTAHWNHSNQSIVQSTERDTVSNTFFMNEFWKKLESRNNLMVTSVKPRQFNAKTKRKYKTMYNLLRFLNLYLCSLIDEAAQGNCAKWMTRYDLRWWDWKKNREHFLNLIYERRLIMSYPKMTAFCTFIFHATILWNKACVWLLQNCLRPLLPRRDTFWYFFIILSSIHK